MDTAVPAARLEFCARARTAFVRLSDAMNAVCSAYDTDFRQLAELHEMETGDSLFENVGLVLTHPPHNVQSKAAEPNSKHKIFTQEDIRNLVELRLEL